MARVRWLMLISGFATILGIAVVIGVIGYRVFRTDGRVSEITDRLPKGAKVLQTTAAGDYVVVTIDVGGTVEIRSFEARSLRPAARLRFATEP